ncbi:DNA repair protein [Bradyrhizobium manausense]|nr:DNA repair protein [Bradyrhizobium manausense]
MHNHPGGGPTPSRADIEMTRVIVEIAKQFGIAIQDHIIVGKHTRASSRRSQRRDGTVSTDRNLIA